MSVAQDAEFLEQVDADQLMDLHRSNLLRLQTTQLLEDIPWHPSRKALELCTQVCDYINSLSGTRKKRVALATETPFFGMPSTDATSATSRAGAAPLLLPKLHAAPVPSSLSLPTKTSGNAKVLPTLQIHVSVDNSFFEPKDYLKHRYFQVRARNKRNYNFTHSIRPSVFANLLTHTHGYILVFRNAIALYGRSDGT